ncbi:MAG: multicopper oxidase domain-containing protein [Vulcanimicrobiaceae bacterium]
MRPLDVQSGNKVLVKFTNTNSMDHPMHLHDHAFKVKDTAGSPPGRTTEADDV